PGRRFASFDNDAAGIAELGRFCREHAVTLVVMEASGGYERRAFVELWETGISCALTNPPHGRRYAQAMGLLWKTDPTASSHQPPMRRCNELGSDPLAKPGPATPEGPCGKAPAGHRRSHRAEAASRKPAR